MKYAVLSGLLSISVALTGCNRDDYGMADDSILCHPVKKEAYIVKPGAWDASFVKRNPDMDFVCNIEK